MSETTGAQPAPEPGAAPGAAPTAATIAAVETQASAPPPEPSPAPAPETPAPAADAPAPVDSRPAEGPKIEPPAPELPGLEDFGKPKAEGETTETKPPEAGELTEYQFKAPEGIEFAAPQVEKYVAVLKEHGITPQVGQSLLDMHAEAMQQFALLTLANQYDVFNATLKSWDQERASDPEIGGSGINTATQLAADARNKVLHTDAERAAFTKMCKDTGCGRHPEFWRAFYRFGRMLAEGEPPPVNREPPPDRGRQRPAGGTGFFSGTPYNPNP